jgi:hypothetical protein
VVATEEEDLSEIEKIYSQSNVSDADARRLVAFANRAIPRLKGDRLALALYRRGLARIQLTEGAEGCDDLRSARTTASARWGSLGAVDQVIKDFCSSPTTTP